MFSFSLESEGGLDPMVDKLEAKGLELLDIILSPLVGVFSSLIYMASSSASSTSFSGVDSFYI